MIREAVRFTMSRSLLLPLAMCLAARPLCLGQSPAQPAVAKYPLRLHILAVDDTHRTVRMQPNWSSGSMPDVSGGDLTPSSNSGATLGGGSDDFSGSGRADLVTPPDQTGGVNFTYEGCSRIRVAAGFQGLEARWTRPGAKLEVVIPTEAIKDGPVPMARCTLKVVPQEFIYLRLHTGVLVRVSPEAYAKKPSLRIFLSGPPESLKRRTPKLPPTQ